MHTFGSSFPIPFALRRGFLSSHNGICYEVKSRSEVQDRSLRKSWHHMQAFADMVLGLDNYVAPPSIYPTMQQTSISIPLQP